MTALLLIVGAAGLVIGGICLVGMCWELGKASETRKEPDR